MEDQDSRNVLGIGPLHKIYVLIQVIFDPKPDEVDPGRFEVNKADILSCGHEFLLNIDGQFTYCFRAYPSNRSEVPSFSQSSSLDAK
jgi:hypothetical protein